MGLYLYNGGLLAKDGALATSQACCCTGCEPCDTCYFPPERYEPQTQTAEGKCAVYGTTTSSAGQGFTTTLPAGVTWKTGYPDALSGCNWRIVIDELREDCCAENCTVNGVPGQVLMWTRFRQKYRLMSIKCPTATEPATMIDLTAQALSGTLEVEYDNLAPNECLDTPDCSGWLSYLSDPVPVCEGFP